MGLRQQTAPVCRLSFLFVPPLGGDDSRAGESGGNSRSPGVLPPKFPLPHVTSYLLVSNGPDPFPAIIVSPPSLSLEHING